MRIAILGPLEVTADDGPVPVAGTRLRGLLIRLALNPGRPVSVGALVRDLWPERTPKRPEHALHELVSRLRRTLPEDAAIRLEAGGYRLDVAALSVDAIRFERLVRGGLLSIDRGDPSRASHQLREALSLWRGPALSDITDLPFAAAAATRLEELRITATESALATELPTRPADPLLLAELEDLITLRPLRERLRLLHIRALHAAARTPDALAAYDRYRTLLATELGTDPGPDLTALHLSLLRGEPEAAQPDSSIGRQSRSDDSGPRSAGELYFSSAESREPAAPPTAAGGDSEVVSAPAGGFGSAPEARVRLRAPLTSFVGRERELGEVGARLTRARLVTLVGPGGAGKTRLAVTLAGASGGRFPGGVGLAELAGVSDPADLPHAVAAGLGVAMSRTFEPSDADPVGLLAEALPNAPTLLVLDNCEHLVEAVARFAEDLLGRVPELRVLATSRQPLGIIGETLWETAPLEVPPPGAPESGNYPAVRLFLDRAAAVRADLVITGTDLDTVADICRDLDGLPLAIELAAAKLRVMPLDTLRARLGNRFGVLANGSRTALPRHRTLRGVLDWDWHLLTDPQRTALARLSVFAAPFTPTAVAALDVTITELEALLDKSLLQLLADDAPPDPSLPSPRPRYRMLESVREYGLEKLTAQCDLLAARSGHAAYYLELAERAQPALRGRDQLAWLHLLDADRGNLIAALRFSHESGDAETAARLGSALGMYWALRGAHAEAVAMLRPVLHLPTDRPYPPLAAAFALHSLLAAQASELTAATADIRRWIGTTPTDSDTGADRASAMQRCDAATISAADGETGPATSPHGGPSGDGAAELAWALVELAAERLPDGLAVVEPWLGHSDAWTRGMFWLARSFLHANDTGVGALEEDLRTAAECFEESGERWARTTALTFLAFTRATLGDFDGATAAIAAALEAAKSLGHAVTLRIWLVMVRLHTGDVAVAREDLAAVLGEPLSAGDEVMAHLMAADIARFEGDSAESARLLGVVEADLNRVMSEDRSYRAMFGLRMGLLRAAEGRVAAAAAHCADAWASAVATRDMPMAAEVSVGVARTCLAAGLAAEAARALGAGHAMRGAPDARYPDVVSLRTELDAVLGIEAAATAYEHGRSLPRAEAMAALESCLAAARTHGV
ncbi:AfsR/SARP family transcriptional regulator [Nocardia concava]|uniref:AfsR/SARP family transcriptional regulator n=1 Tax=Nocardia concava TaxID=257281 RepID=UPI0002FEF655|nr:BTAD domain-containing putative transcriptional regulator [Nocardia concava]